MGSPREDPKATRLAQAEVSPCWGKGTTPKDRDPNMRFQVNCAPTHAKFLVDSNLNKSVLINLIIENHYGKMPGEPKQLPN